MQVKVIHHFSRLAGKIFWMKLLRLDFGICQRNCLANNHVPLVMGLASFMPSCCMEENGVGLSHTDDRRFPRRG